MDYCSACRRKLNGALVCTGCGAYAPDIDPWLAAERRAAGTAESGGGTRTVSAGRAVAVDEGIRPAEGAGESPRPLMTGGAGAVRTRQPLPVRPVPRAVPPADLPPEFADTPPESARPAAGGRLRGRRTAAAATALAFIGGGLTLAAMSSESHTDPKDTASSVPDPAGALPLTTSAPTEPTTSLPPSAAHPAKTRHAPSSHTPGHSHRELPGGQVMPPASTTASSATQTGVPYSSPSSRPGTRTPPTTTSSAPSASAPTSPTATPRHRVCILSLCFD